MYWYNGDVKWAAAIREDVQFYGLHAECKDLRKAAEAQLLVTSVFPESPSLDKPLCLSVTQSSLQSFPKLKYTLLTHIHCHLHKRAHTQRQTPLCSPPTASSATLLFRRRARRPVGCYEKHLVGVRSWQKCGYFSRFSSLSLVTFYVTSFFGTFFSVQQSRSLLVNKLVNCISNFRTGQLDKNQYLMDKMNNSVK